MTQTAAAVKGLGREASVSSSALKGFSGVLAGLISLQGVSSLIQMAEAYNEMAERVQMATLNTAEFNMVQTRLLDTANKTWRDADLAIADRALRRLITVPLNDWQRAALIDFTYNLGAGNLAESTMRRKFNAGDYAGGCAELGRWVKGRVGGVLVTLPGLVTRREADTWVCLRR